MTRLFSILILLTIRLTTFGQHDFGIKLNGGLSKITANKYISNVTSKYSFAPSGQGGLFYNLNYGKKSLIGVELLFSQIESKEESKATYTYFGNPTEGFGITNIDYHISYFSIPIYYGFKIKKLTINLGVQTSFAFASRGHSIDKTTYNGNTFTSENESKLNIDKFDFGPRTGLLFNLSKRFAFEATYYYGLNNILSNTAPPDWKWKIQQITIGLRYKFFTLIKKDKPTEEKK